MSSAEDFRAFLHSATVPMHLVGTGGVIVAANGAELAMLGYATEDYVGHHVAEFHVDAAVGADLLDRLSRAEPLRNYAARLRCADGSIKHVQLSSSVRREDGGVAHICCFTRDVSEEKAAEAAHRAQDEFLAAVAHELRTPLNAMLGWARLLRSGTVDAETVARGLAAVERNAEVQEQLISDLLDVARIVAGKMQLRIATTDLARVVEEAVDAVRHTAAARGLVLDVHVDREVAPLLADGERLRQVVCNLLSNAIRFTPEGGRIVVELRAGDGRATIRVADQGIGIAPELLPHVFDRFRQAEAGTTRRRGGLGLGLSIVRSLVAMHGGTVRAESDGERRGAMFTVELPVPAPSVSPVPRVDTTGTPPSLEHVRVLVVDDDTDGRELLGMLLRTHGADVTEAASAEEAVAAFCRSVPDVVLSDIGLPDTDGYRLMRRLRALDVPGARDALAVAFTGWARREDRDAALEAGFQAHVVKPVDPNELVGLLSRLVRMGREAPVSGTGIAPP